MHPALRSWRNWWLWRDDAPATLLQLAAYGGGIAAAAAIAMTIVTPFRIALPETPPAPKVEWLEVEKPFPAFALSIPEAGDAVANYAIKRHATGGGRKDILTLGDPGTVAPSLRVEIYRPGRENETFGSVLDEIAGQAAILGAATPLVREANLDSKFGSFGLATFTLAGEPARRCVGFAKPYEEPRLQIAGAFCQGGDAFVSRETLTCALDRLTLNAAGGDPKTATLFAQAEQRRSFCGQRNPLLAPTPKYPVLWKAIEQRQKAAAR